MLLTNDSLNVSTRITSPHILIGAAFHFMSVSDEDTFVETLPSARNGQLKQLARGGFITWNEFHRLLKQPWDLPAFYLLPKVHKALHPVTHIFAGRPIIGTTRNPLQNRDLYLVELTNAILNEIPDSLKDTGALLRQLEALPNISLKNLLIRALYQPWRPETYLMIKRCIQLKVEIGVYLPSDDNLKKIIITSGDENWQIY